MKKGQGLPLNAVVLMIIVLIVMVVIIAIFAQNFGKSTGQLDIVQAKNEARTACISADDFDKCVEECDKAIDQSNVPEKCKLGT